MRPAGKVAVVVEAVYGRLHTPGRPPTRNQLCRRDPLDVYLKLKKVPRRIPDELGVRCRGDDGVGAVGIGGGPKTVGGAQRVELTASG